jgi:hypothetical protein
MTIAVDFDGTCVTHDYPRVGKDIGAVPVLKALVANGHKLILFTMRDGPALQDAVSWFKDRGIPLYGVNENPDWSTGSPKVYPHLYIDDAALGAPLMSNGLLSGRMFINWETVKQILKNKQIL